VADWSANSDHYLVDFVLALTARTLDEVWVRGADQWFALLAFHE
jgi:hypothetical protein